MKPISRERWMPWVASVVAFCGGLTIAHCGHALPSSENFFGAMLTLGGILAGFIATMKTLLQALGRRVVQRLMHSGYQRYLRIYADEALWGSILLCVAAIAGFFFISERDSVAKTLACAVSLALAAFAMTAMVRFAAISNSLLEDA